MEIVDLTRRGRALTRPPLARQQIAQLDYAYLALTRAMWVVAADVGDVTWHLQVPKLPEALSASIAVTVAGELSGWRYRLELPHPKRAGDPDSWAVAPREMPRRCELKGTGARGWVSVGAVDRKADLVIWIDYSARLRDQRNRVRVLELPGSVFGDRRGDDCELSEVEKLATATVFYDPWTRRVTELPRARSLPKGPPGSWQGWSLN